MDLRTLLARVSWADIFECLGQRPRTAALPALTTCPLCGGPLHVVQDSITRRAWHYCSACESRGDIIELVAKVRKLKPDEAVVWLSQNGIDLHLNLLNPDRWRRQLRSEHRSREVADEYQEVCRQRLVHTPEYVAHVLQAHGLVKTSSAEHWLNGPGRFVGCTSSKLATRYFSKQVKNGNNQHIIVPRDNGDYLTFGYETVPYGLSSFLFVGGRRGCDRIHEIIDAGESVDDRFHRRGPRQVLRRFDAGLHGLGALQTATKAFGTTVFAFDDPLLALRLQIRHAQTSNESLPIVAYYDGPRSVTRQSWETLGRRRIVFWGMSLTAELIAHAMRANGLIAIMPGHVRNDNNVDTYLRRWTPLQILKRASAAALPWQKYLKKWAKEVGDRPVADILERIEAYGFDYDMAGASTRIKKVFANQPVRRAVFFPNANSHACEVIEREGCWYSRLYKGEEVVIMNGTLRIVRLMPYGGVRYRAILSVGKRWTLVEMPNHAMAAAEAVKRAAERAGICLAIRWGWERRLLAITKLFRTAEDLDYAVARPSKLL